MTVYRCPTCNKIHRCDNGECKGCHCEDFCKEEVYSNEADEECWDCRKGSITFSAGGG